MIKIKTTPAIMNKIANIFGEKSKSIFLFQYTKILPCYITMFSYFIEILPDNTN